MNFIEKFRYGVKSGEEIEREREHVNAALREVEALRKKYEDEAGAGRRELDRLRQQVQLEMQQQREQLEVERSVLAERERKLADEQVTIDERWAGIRGQLAEIFNEKKSIADTWKSINAEWERIFQHHPGLKEKYAGKSAAAIDARKHDKADERPMDKAVMEKLHEKEIRTVAKDEVVSYRRKDHPALHGHKDE